MSVSDIQLHGMHVSFVNSLSQIDTSFTASETVVNVFLESPHLSFGEHFDVCVLAAPNYWNEGVWAAVEVVDSECVQGMGEGGKQIAQIFAINFNFNVVEMFIDVFGWARSIVLYDISILVFLIEE